MSIVGVWEVCEDKHEDGCDLCEYKDDARGMMRTHNTSFHTYMLCICNNFDYETEKSIQHGMVACRATKEVRDRLLPDLLNTVLSVQPTCAILLPSPKQLIIGPIR